MLYMFRTPFASIIILVAINKHNTARVASCWIIIYILTPLSFYLYFEREMYYLSFIFYTEWRKDPWTLEATH